jgi:uncharacterized protein (TIGR03435 family)
VNVIRGVAAFCICTLPVFAQTNARPEFEVASIKPTASDQRGSLIVPNGEGINFINFTLRQLIMQAYRILLFQVSGGPSWIDSEHYDISAKTEASQNPNEISSMLQALLADRFQLKLHRETKEMPGYALVVARKDGKLGRGLVEAKEGGCKEFVPGQPLPRFEPGKTPPLGCGGLWMAATSLKASAISMDQLAPMFARTFGRTVVDKTGLTGKFDIDMDWTPDASPRAPDDAARPALDLTGILLTALPEQLGLKLESQRGPVEMFIIDSVEKASEN